MDKTIEIFILTFNQEINVGYDENLYFPLVCGEGLENKKGYFYDNTGENISNLNKYYSELTGEYWAWKNTSQDIIGFCHYRRWFAKNFKWEKITKKDILEDLDSYDIILPHKKKFIKPLYEFHKDLNVKKPNYDVLYEDYIKVGEVLKKMYPDYAKTYDDVMNGKYIWTNNMFICKRELAEEYFEWLFNILEILVEEIDLSKYNSRDTRIFGFIAERLFTTYVIHNKLKFKEYYQLRNERKFPFIYVLNSKFPIFEEIEIFITDLLKKS